MQSFRFHKEFVLRVPRHPFQHGVTNSESLKDTFSSKILQEAIYIASPDLHDAFQNWVKGKLTNEKIVSKLNYSLYKYWNRMSTRCTPYGLFASCTIGTFSEKSEINILSEIRSSTRLDMNFVCAAAHHLAKHPSIQPYLLFYSNSSSYSLGEQLRYVEYKYLNNQRVHTISSVDLSEYLHQLLNFARNGATVSDLTSLLTAKKINSADAIAFIQEIIGCQLLLCEIEPAVTGLDFLEQLLRLLASINAKAKSPDISDLITCFKNVKSGLAEIDANSENEIQSYQKLIIQLRSFGIPLEVNQLFQVDSFASTKQASLDEGIQKKIINAISFLKKVKKANKIVDLDKFKNSFSARFENREMPILEILDTESGFGYPSRNYVGLNNFIDEIQIPAENNFPSVSWNTNENFIFKKLIYAIKHGDKIVQFSDKDVRELSEGNERLAPSFSVMFKVLHSEQGKIQLNYIGGGSSAANLLGRFAYGDEKIHNIIKDIVSFEKSIFTNKILAEIVHLPESRVGNILLRPVLRDFEIPYLGKSAAPRENQILLEDILVSVRNNRIVLRSKRLNKEIIPRLSTAHNYSNNSLPAYKFLCDLQLQDIEDPFLAFSWGTFSNAFTFLPRAEFGDIVLFPATWNLSSIEFAGLSKKIETDNFITEVKIWQEKWEMPRFVVLKDGDNELLVDFESELSIKTFFNEIRKRSVIELAEFLFDPENALVKDKQGRPYANEIIATVFNHDYKPSAIIEFQEKTSDASVKRNFIPGSEWLFYKIYCGVKTADDILISTIKPIIEELTKNELIENWFFIRYADPETHVRLRFYNKDISKLNEAAKLITAAFAPLIEHGVISKIQTDTYIRELERYGSQTIELAEKYFSIDSYAILMFLDEHRGDAGEEIKWKFATCGVVELMDSFQYPSNEKLRLMEKLKTGFIAEHSTDKSLKVQLDSKFRKMRPDLENLFQIENSKKSFSAILHWKKNMIQPIVDEILKIREAGELEVELDDLIASYMHMTLNRIFKAKQRTHEMVVYDLLYRYYKSTFAKEKYQKNSH